jgi:sulfite reductase beta subunit-like hemoprotein
MKAKQPQLCLQTPDDKLNADEVNKLNSNGVRGQLHDHLRDMDRDDIVIESEKLLKAHGVYLEYNRAKTGREKDWMYMARLTVPGGGTINAGQWHILNDLADKYCDDSPFGGPSLRLTTRQNIQYHWLKKPNLIKLVSELSQTGFYTLNGCGDVVRNVMGCPLSRFSDIFDANALARKFGAFFRLPAAPHIAVFGIDPGFVPDPDVQYKYEAKLLNRKFKIAFSAVHRDEKTGKIVHDNCVELRTNDIGIAPIIENETVVAYQVYVGGGQGEKNGKPTFAAHGEPLGVFTEENLLHGLRSIVDVHSAWGDRNNRNCARLKYVVHKQGIAWYADQVRQLGGVFESPKTDFDPGPRMLHHGWHTQPTNGKLAYGAYIGNGRLIDGPNGKLKSMVPALLEQFQGVETIVTPNQDLLFTNIPADAKEDFAATMQSFGHGKRNGKTYSKLRLLSGACVGLPTCRLSYTESEGFEPELVDQLEEKGYGDVSESIGITGCERQCFRPSTKTIGWIGQGPNLYMLRIGGSEDARHQGTALVLDGRLYLRQTPRDKVADVTAVLFDLGQANRQNDDEDYGAVLRRIGTEAIIEHLKQNPATAPLMEKTHDAPYQPHGCATDLVTA